MSRAAKTVNRECGTATVISVGSGELLGDMAFLCKFTSTNNDCSLHSDKCKAPANCHIVRLNRTLPSNKFIAFKLERRNHELSRVSVIRVLSGSHQRKYQRETRRKVNDENSSHDVDVAIKVERPVA